MHADNNMLFDNMHAVSIAAEATVSIHIVSRLQYIQWLRLQNL